MRRLVTTVLLTAGLLPGAERFDVVVYGATAGGVVAAVAAANEGVKCALLEPGRHVGGMVSGGLGRTDNVHQENLVGGYAKEFFARVGRHYGQPLTWFFEPKVAERVFRDWLDEAGVKVFYEHRLASVLNLDGRIASARMANGAEFAAEVFLDASYEGDLMKMAGVSYDVGRESRSKYGESLAGRREFMVRHHQFKVAVSPYGPDGKLLPYIQREDEIGLPGEGDGKLQSYCFRLCLTTDPKNQVPIRQPKNYDPDRYGLLKNYLEALVASGMGETLRPGTFLGISKMPNSKTDINAKPPISTNLLGASWEYPEASHQRRREIWREHRNWAHGLLFFLGNDLSVPEPLRAEMRRYGLPKDEFADTGHWPHQLYIREGRRMVGEYVLTQHDLMERTTKYDSIGMGGYNIDIREVQWVAAKVFRFPEVHEEVVEEGYVSQTVKPYQIPYRSLLPRSGESANLLVPVCASASHVAFASYRMEPQYMIAGHSAGVAAALAVQTNRPVHKIDLVELQTRLRRQGQILSLEDPLRE